MPLPASVDLVAPAVTGHGRPLSVAGPALPPLRAGRLLDQVRERARGLHFSLRTEEAYVHWCRAFVRFHGLRHPAEMAGPEG